MRPTGVWRAVLVSSALFGLVHLSNAMLRGSLGLAALQALGAGTEGFGLAALRLRTNTVWPLVALHALHDLFLQFGYLPIPLVSAAYSVVLFAYGIYLLRDGALRSQLGHEAEPLELPSTRMAA